MKKFNVCLIRPTGYIHSGAFIELAEVILYSLRELGYSANLATNKIEPDAKNIMIGVHLLDAKYINDIPKDSIILNTEQLSSVYSNWNANILKWFGAGFELWDYSNRNIEYLSATGIPKVKKFNLGYQKELCRITRNEKRDIDVLFYGSINERRKIILDGLQARGLNVKLLFGVYGQERDGWIKRSKVVLNHHFYDSQIFEMVRVFYLLTNSVAVVGEVNKATMIEKGFKEGVFGSPYEGLIDKTVEIVSDSKLLNEYEEHGFASISKYPQTAFTRAVL